MRLDDGDLELIANAVADELQRRMLDNGRISYSEAEAAEQLGMSKAMLRDRRLAGEIEGIPIGRSHFYKRSTLVRYLNKHKANGVHI